MTAVPSFTYAGGELAPGLWGRVDLNKYQTGVKLARNFHVGVEGGLIKRVGMYYVGSPKYENLWTKLVRWRIADDDSYVMEFGHQYIRFYRLGGPVLYPGGHTPHADSDAIDVGGFLEVPTTYDHSHVRQLKFTFANDVVYIFHPSYPPAKLTRLGLYDWDLATINFNPHEAAPTGLAGEWQEAESTGWEPADPDPVTDYVEVQKPYQYRVSATMPGGLETLASAPVTVNADLGNSQLRVLLTWDAKAGAEKYTVYKGEHGIFGFIGYTEAGVLEYADDNIAPSYDVVPVEEWGGFGEDVSEPNAYPRVGQFYKQRLAYAATYWQPQSLWFSRPNHFHSMSRSIPAQDDDAIHINLVGNERHTINHLLQLKRFIAFTDSGEWIISGADNQALTGATINPVQETAYGSDRYLEPLPIGNRILFVQNISRTVRDMGYEFTSDAYSADDLSRLARHLFENTYIYAWSYSNFPNNALWCVKADWTFCAMTYVREHEIWGWTSMETRGAVLDVAVTPEEDQDATYFLVERYINGVRRRFIERSEVLFTSEPDDLFYVDCGLTYKDEHDFTDMIRWNDTTISIGVVGHARSAGDEVQLENADLSLRFVVTDVVPGGFTAVTKYDKVMPEAFTTTSGKVLFCASTVSGFTHLANQTGLVALIDGFVQENVTIEADGTFELDVPAARVHIGFPYTARVETLDIDNPRVAGQYRYKSVDGIKLHLKDSRGVFAGASAATERGLEEIEGRSDEDYDEANRLLNGVFEIQPHTEWAMSCGVTVEAPYPLPCHILNIVPDVSYAAD